MTLEEILTEIYNQGMKIQVYKILHAAVMEDYNKLLNENRECSASLTAIKKINKGRNEAIDALCD
ncbi:hypothetical protein GKG47_09105 [Lactonifactor sp. BIOML-A3]|uniref:hypothetical protein n=1 Tax=unclassified Lactonifactor TaxID=2636670 RepID=UPI0012B14A10|nr:MULTISPECIES: hypothetical protein [unclassified Lactonifactor]MSA02196.1 hypothetical protein [Lactonifactor sp. BIOML-A5]MSA07981.1 hypothetical protein [Lactonifactor sp. BIOML-A4]MSA12597.1 hypothetical protein [Lactonifactor sp. BIOML-A3]MSA16702.1 hypothetical protein [Lactonifactor sp. BIOML-A2]MSA37599.1 hypothetical protein [Lactonifactor sp. BIOML-A1]